MTQKVDWETRKVDWQGMLIDTFESRLNESSNSKSNLNWIPFFDSWGLMLLKFYSSSTLKFYGCDTLQ